MRKHIVAIVLAGCASRGAAQAPSLAGLDSLRAAATAALVRVKAYDDSVRAATTRLDSVRVGPMRLYAESQVAALATAAARQTVESLRPRMGSSLDRLSRYSYTVRVSHWRHYRTARPDSEVVIDVYDRTGPSFLNLRQKFDTALVSTSLRIYAPYLVYRDASASFTAWMANQVSVDSLNADDWRGVRLAMVSSPAAVGRRCFEGDMNACQLALQLKPSDDPVREWYDETDRVRLVKRTIAFANTVDAAAAARCVAQESFSCISLLHRYPSERIPAPLPASTRATIVRLALTLGGSGAVDRLLADRPDPMERVAAAAQLPADSVLAQWQQRVRHQRASSRDLSAEIVTASLFWALALGALSLRSSRWR